MTSGVKTLLLFILLLAVVVAGGLLYTRSLQLEPGGSAPAASAPAVPLSPEIESALEALRAGRPGEARAGFEAIAPTDPNYAVALHNLAQLEWQSGDNAAALERFRGLARLQPENSEVQVGLSWAYYMLDRDAEAEYAALRALELDPNQLNARYNVALFRVAQGREADAIDAYHRAIRLDTAQSYTSRSFEDLRMLQQSRPDLPAVHYALAFYANLLQQPELERESLARYLALAPDGPGAVAAREKLFQLGG